MTISFGSCCDPEAIEFSNMRSGFFVASREVSNSPAYLYLKLDDKLYCFGRPGDSLVIPSTIVLETARNKQFYRYKRVDLDITVRPL